MNDKMKKSYEKINISAEAKERIEMAIKKDDEKRSSWNKVLRKNSCKVAIAACLSVCLVPTGVYAGSKIYKSFQSTVTENNRKADIEINKPNGTTMPTAKVVDKDSKEKDETPEVTPQKFIKITADFGKDYSIDKNDGGFQGYSHKGGYEAGKSFWYELNYMDGDKKTILSTYNNKESEQIKINGRKAFYCNNGGIEGTQYSSDFLTDYGQAIYILVEDYGYVIRMGAQCNLSKDEFIKLAEKLKISEVKSKKEASDYLLYSKAVTPAWEMKPQHADKHYLNTKYYSTDGKGKFDGGTVKVTDVKVLDSVASLDRKTFAKFGDGLKYDKLFDKDGKIKSYEREQIKSGDGITSPERKVEKTETIHPKMVYVTAEYENVKGNSEHEYVVPSLILYKNDGSKLYEIGEEYNRPSYVSDAMLENMPCYFKESKGGTSYYFAEQKNGKTILHFAYLVDEDQVNGMALCLNSWEPNEAKCSYIDISQK